MRKLRKLMTDIEDLPQTGILLRNISPLFKLRFRETIDTMSLLFSTHPGVC